MDVAPRPIQFFKSLWAQGTFDNTEYFALTAPVREWMAHFPHHCISEKAPGITDDDWGIVTWKLVVYIYSSEEKARHRALDLGGNVKPLKLKCLSCFLELFSAQYPFVDLILDESWHIQALTCRDSDYSKATHFRLQEPDACFQLVGCAGNGSLRWMPYRLYGDPKMPHEYCRPVPFPGYTVMIDHKEQGGYMDMEILTPPDSITRFLVGDHLFGRDPGAPLKGRSEILFARPIGSIAFADLMGEKVRLLRGDGVWVPVATRDSSTWHFPPWAGDVVGVVKGIKDSDPTDNAVQFREDSHSFANRAFAVLEGAFLSGEVDPSSRQSACNEALALLKRGADLTSFDWYTKTLHQDLAIMSLDQVPALIHADRINWGASCGLRDVVDSSFEMALRHRKEYEHALYNHAVSLKHLGSEEWVESLSRLLKANPSHPQGCFEKALIAMEAGNEEEEMRLYALAVESDPSYAPPWYNMGMTYEQRENYKKAWDCYLKALDADPFHVEASEQLGFILQRQGRNEQAAKMFTRALFSDPLRKVTYEHIAEVCEATGDEDLMQFAARMFKQFLPREFNDSKS